MSEHRSARSAVPFSNQDVDDIASEAVRCSSPILCSKCGKMVDRRPVEHSTDGSEVSDDKDFDSTSGSTSSTNDGSPFNSSGDEGDHEDVFVTS